MQFISNGDFGFPFEAAFYWIKSFFIWSFQNGAANPDGIIRIPSILPNAIVFELFGNLAASYFYIFLVFAVCFVSFYLFARKFIGVESPLIASIGAAFFTFNPIFLGNIAKVGLTLAVAMLPLILMLVKRAFETGRFRYLIICLFLVTISLVHPFTCVVNVLIAGGYLLFMLWRHRKKLPFRWGQLFLLPLIAVAINLYFILPIINIGTVSKDVISQDVSSTHTSYTDLVDVANTGDMLTSMSLTKNVLKDFEFYNTDYQTIFFVAIFAFYVLLFGLYLQTRNRWSVSDQRSFLMLGGGFLGLTLIATGTFLNIDRILKYIIGLPGGWMFRSPLKWQLYIPFFLFGALVLLLKNLPREKLRYAYGALIIIFLFINSFVFGDVYRKILTPRSIEYFTELHKTDLDGKSILAVNSRECNDFSRMYPNIQTELRQIVKSQNVQFKTVGVSLLDETKVKDFDFVLGCKDDIQGELAQQGFDQMQEVKERMAVYRNKQPTPYIYATDQLYRINGSTAINDKQRFASANLHNTFTFVSGKQDVPGAQNFAQVFGQLKRDDIRDGKMTSVVPLGEQSKTLYAQSGNALSYRVQDRTVSMSTEQKYPNKVSANQLATVPLTSATTFSYEDPKFDYKNMLTNGSLEDGLWHKKVGDCSAYDTNPRIAMEQSNESAHGEKSLQLQTGGHIACTSPPTIKVEPGARYLLSFSYQNVQGRTAAGYNIAFDNEKKNNFGIENALSLSERLDDGSNAWQRYDKEITAPEGTRYLHLTMYAYPDSTSSRTSIARYDNLSLVKIPDIHDEYYVVEQRSGTAIQKPAHLTVDRKNPTHKKITVESAKGNFYLVMKDGFGPRWRITQDGGTAQASKILNKHHFKVNNAANGWYIDVAALCGDNASCQKNADGSYTFGLTIDYTPQKWFVVGGVFSLVTFVCCISWILYDRRKE